MSGKARRSSATRRLPHRLHEELTLGATAARLAACFRALADSLAARGNGPPWVDATWLRFLDAAGNRAPATARRIRDAFGSFDASSARRVRTAVRTSRLWHERPSGGVWLSPIMNRGHGENLAGEVLRVANDRPDKRFGFSARSAPALLQVAQWLEQEFALPPQPPIWCYLRRGALNGVATELARGLWEMGIFRPSDGPSGGLCMAGPLDLLQPGDRDSTPLEYRDWCLLERLNRFLQRHPAHQHGWRRAEVRIEWLHDRQDFGINVALETAQPFGIARHWFVNGDGPFQMDAMRVSHWPDASPAMRVQAP